MLQPLFRLIVDQVFQITDPRRSLAEMRNRQVGILESIASLHLLVGSHETIRKD